MMKILLYFLSVYSLRGEVRIAEKSFRETATGHVHLYTDEPLLRQRQLRWLNDFCRTAAPY